MGYHFAFVQALVGVFSCLSFQLGLPTSFDVSSRLSQDRAAQLQLQPQPQPQPQPQQPQQQRDAAEPGGSAVDRLLANCPQLPRQSPAASVRALRPADVRVVAAVGDSVTAAFAARGYVPLEFRGLSFSMGGEPGRVTLPNLLGRFAAHPPIVGPATGATDPLRDAARVFRPEPLGPVAANVAHLNAAVSNARSTDGPAQVEWLTGVMQHYEAQGLMSIQQDWKLLTLMLGANDLRGKCHGSEPIDEVAKNFKAAINKTLGLIHQRFPRTLVSLLAVPNVGDMGRWAHSTRVCSWVQDHLETLCPRGGRTPVVQKVLNAALEELGEYWSNSVRADDFAVVYHPFSGNISLPNATYLSEADCFHPGERGHAETAVGLWNSLLTPRRNKSTSLLVGTPVVCPAPDSVLHVD